MSTDSQWQEWKATLKEIATALVTSDMVGLIKEAYKEMEHPLTPLHELADTLHDTVFESWSKDRRT